jgi:molybdopterin/thiamine biosynthesis adenylyltransferase
MAASFHVPPNVRAAYDALKASGVCTVDRALEAKSSNFSTFDLLLTLPEQNAANLPQNVKLTAIVPHTFPYDAITFIPPGESIRGFPHQDAETGKLCLPSESEAPWDSSRLIQYVRWAHEWLVDAANGTLLKNGDPYELPDFSRKTIKGNRFVALPPILFAESDETFPVWNNRIGQSGPVELIKCKDARAIIAQKFFTDAGTVIFQPSFSLEIAEEAQAFLGQWILLPKITVHRHRPPQTYKELFDLCRSCDVKISHSLRQAWAVGKRDGKFGLLLVGFPIPRLVGDSSSEIHWQPIFFTNQDVAKRSFKGRGKADQGRLWSEALQSGSFKPTNPVLWGKSTNVARERLYARGSLPLPARQATVAIIGCGALGSIVAESFARSGIRRLFLFDGDVVEYGNLARHTLDGRHVGIGKAEALAHRLSSANPLTTITGYPVAIPLNDDSDGSAQRALQEADVLIDCSTDQGAFLWLSRFTRSDHKRLASLFINPRATLLTLVLSGQHTPCHKVFECLNAAIAAGNTPVPFQEYFAEPTREEIIIPGAGCWHPTFPALNRHIWLLACSAVDLLVSWLQHPYRCDGHGILIRRFDVESTGPTVEILWNKPYR